MTNRMTKTGPARILQKGLTFLGLCVLAATAGRETHGLEIVQTFNQSTTATTWNVAVALNQFDPALGTLTEVQIDMSTSWSGTGSVTNNSGSTATFRIRLVGEVALTKSEITESGLDPNWLLDFAESTQSSAISIPNTESRDYTPSPWSGSSNATLTDQADLDEFIGTGTLPTYLKAVGTSSITGPSPYLANVTTSASASLTLKYIYTPVPEPATWALGILSSGVIGIDVVRRRRRKIKNA